MLGISFGLYAFTSLSVTVTGGGSVVGLSPLVLALAEEEECKVTVAGVEAAAGIFPII